MEPWIVLAAMAITVFLTGVIAFRAGRAAHAPGPDATEVLARLDALERRLSEQQGNLAEEAAALRALIDGRLADALESAADHAHSPRAFRAVAG